MERLIKFFSLVLVLVIAISCESKRTGDDSNEVAEEANEEMFEDRDVRKDADFLADEVAANYAEIQMAKLATQKASHAEVKNVAQILEMNHAKTLEELQNLASKKAITVPNEPEDAHKRKMDNLRDESDAKEFSKEWCKEMIDMHEKTIEKYEDQLESTEDADLKAWINQKLPDMRSHLSQLKACNDKLKDV